MVAMNTLTVTETVWKYRTEGTAQVQAEADRLAGSLTKLASAQDKATDADGKATAAAGRSAQARQSMAAVLERAERQNQAAMTLAALAANANEQSLSEMAEVQMRAAQVAAQAAAQQRQAVNDNVVSLEKQTGAFKEAGKFALEHPVLVLAGSAAAARALAGLATSAAGSLAAASAATAGYAAASAEMGGAVAAGAAVAARGLGLVSTAATAGAAGLGLYAEKMSDFLSTTSMAYNAAGLLGRGLSVLPGILGPVGLAFVAFEAGAAAISKAYSDLDRLIALGEKARGLDVSAPFLKSFEGLGAKIQATTDQMDAALKQASSFVKEQFGGPNAALKQVSDLYSQGAFGADKPAAMAALETATTTQDKVRATLDLIKELQSKGQEFAALDLTEKLMGPEVADRLRTGQASIAQMVTDLNSLQDKEILRQEQVDRALAINKEISDAKQGIYDAIAITFDFSSAAMAANEAWLKILQAVQWVVEKINAANAASADFIGTATTTMLDGLKTAGAAAGAVATDLLEKYNIIAKRQAAAEVQGPPEMQGPAYQITARSFPYTFGPNLPDSNTNALRQQGAAAKEAASAIDILTKRTSDHIAEMDLETRSIGQSTAAVIKLKLTHDLERAALKDGVEVTDAMRESWDRLGDKLAESTIRLAENKRAFDLMKEGQRELASDFTTFVDDIVLGGKKMEEAFQSLAKSLGSNALKALISGEGPLAGILGTASNERGQIGGVLGGKIDLGGLFDVDKVTSALGIGAETGIGKALAEALKPSKAGGGVLSSPLGQGLAAVGTGAAVGYSSQSPLAGAAAGALAGLASGNPYLAVAGAGAGLLGGLFGESEARKQAKKKLEQELQARREALAAARPQIEALAITFEGGSIGNVGKQIADAQAQAYQAIKTASDGGDRALADRLMKDFQAYVARMVAVYAQAFEGTMAEIQAGFGVSGPFSQAVAAVQQLGEALKGFVADAGRLADPAAAARAQAAAVQGALASLDPPKTLSATQTELARIQGTATGLNQVLKDLGLSAEQAASAIAERTNKALDALRDKFTSDLTRKINDAQGKSYLNDVADLIKEVAGLNVDAQAVGGDLGQVQTYFQAAAQKIVDSSSLTGDAFSALIQQFPELNGLVHAFSDSLTDTASSLAAIAARQTGFQDRAFAATNDSTTLDGSLAAYDRKAMQERAAEVKAGGQAIVDLEAAQAAERVQIITDFAQKAADALNARLKGYADRYFAATTDTSTLGGQLDAYDRKAQAEREDEIKAGGDAIAQLEQTQAAERLKIISDFGKQAADALEQQMQAAQTAFDTFARNIKTFVDGLRAGSSSPLAPKDRLAQAQSQYDAQLALAQGGDRTALDSITTYAQTLLDASKAYNASNSAFQATFERVAAQLTALPTQVSAEQFIVNAITDSKTALVSTTQAMQAALLAGIQSNSPNLVAAALNANFTRLDTSVNGLLDYNEFLAGVGPLATTAEQQAARSIFNQIDANGDGQISKLEAANASSYRVEGYTNSTSANIAQSNQILNNQNAILNAQNALASQQSQLLASINQLSDASLGTQQQIANLNNFIQTNTAYTNDLLLRQFNTLASIYDINNISLANLRAANGRSGAAVYAEGGWVSGPGTGTSDSIAARLSNGEFVVNAASARLNGPLLEALNDNLGFQMPAVAMPIPVAAGMGDTAAMVAELRALRSEVAALRSENREDSRMVASATAAGARHVGGKVDAHVAETRKGNVDRRQDGNRPRLAGTKAA